MPEREFSFDDLDLHSDNVVPAVSDADLGDVDENSLKDQIRDRYKQDTLFRKLLANWVMYIVPIWLAVVLVIFITHGLRWLYYDSSVMIALLVTTTANVLGLAYIVLKGIFNQK